MSGDDDQPHHEKPLAGAQRLGQQAAQCGFDWRDADGPLAKIEEECEEIRELIDRAGPVDSSRVGEEVGDLLFAVVNLARHLDVEAADALREGNRKFSRRFARVQQLVKQRGLQMEQLELEQLERLWQRAKREETED